jgi:hypothetical protein
MKKVRRLELAVLILLAGLSFWLFWPRQWWNPAVAMIEMRGGKVTVLTTPTLRGRLAVTLPATVTDEDLERMTSLDKLEPVWILLQGGPVSNRGVASLQRFHELRGLSLAHTKVDDQGLEHLMALPYLETLNLENCAITDRGLEGLRQLSPLRDVSLYGTGITAKGARRLQAKRPDLKVRSEATDEED